MAIAIGNDSSSLLRPLGSIRPQIFPLPSKVSDHTKIGMIQCLFQTSNGLFTTGESRSDKIPRASGFLDHRVDWGSSGGTREHRKVMGGGGPQLVKAIQWLFILCDCFYMKGLRQPKKKKTILGWCLRLKVSKWVNKPKKMWFLKNIFFLFLLIAEKYGMQVWNSIPFIFIVFSNPLAQSVNFHCQMIYIVLPWFSKPIIIFGRKLFLFYIIAIYVFSFSKIDCSMWIL